MKSGDQVKFINDNDLFCNNLILQSMYNRDSVDAGGMFVKVNGHWYYQRRFQLVK